MTYHVDNQPNYLTSRKPEYKGASYEVEAKSEVKYTDPDDMCDPSQQTVLLRVTETQGPCDVRDVKQLLARAVTPQGCYCEHDCCGHRHGHASVEALKPDLYLATVYTSRNY